jgi:hypothetical protein
MQGANRKSNERSEQGRSRLLNHEELADCSAAGTYRMSICVGPVGGFAEERP